MKNGVCEWRVWSLPRIIAVILPFSLSPLLLAQVFPPEVKKASEAFVCQCGCNHQLSACGMVNCGSATPLRQEIAEHLKQGKTQQQIVDAFVAKYGKVILSAPTTQGIDLAAWMTPFVVLMLGLFLVYVVIKTWVRRRPALFSGKASSIPEDYRQRMERELKDLEP
jgi:cytochrome c-type biogenesis protein CcmH/NrfF